MNDISLKKAFAAGLAGAVLLTGSARAVTASAGDLILGFRAGGGQGSGQNLEVNLGPVTGYTGLAPNSTMVVSRLSVLDLVETYGNDWDSRDDLSFGIVGAVAASAWNGFSARTIWASSRETTPGELSLPWQRGSVSAQQNAAGAITTMYSGAGGSLSNAAATAHSAYSAVIDITQGGSWTFQDDIVAGQSFRRFTPSVTMSLGDIPLEPSVYDGLNGYAVLDLWQLRSNAGSGDGEYAGSFGLNANGQLVYSNNQAVFLPVPEPATLTLALTAVAFAARRRRTATL